MLRVLAALAVIMLCAAGQAQAFKFSRAEGGSLTPAELRELITAPNALYELWMQPHADRVPEDSFYKLCAWGHDQSYERLIHVAPRGEVQVCIDRQLLNPHNQWVDNFDVIYPTRWYRVVLSTNEWWNVIERMDDAPPIVPLVVPPEPEVVIAVDPERDELKERVAENIEATESNSRAIEDIRSDLNSLRDTTIELRETQTLQKGAIEQLDEAFVASREAITALTSVDEVLRRDLNRIKKQPDPGVNQVTLRDFGNRIAAWWHSHTNWREEIIILSALFALFALVIPFWFVFRRDRSHEVTVEDSTGKKHKIRFEFTSKDARGRERVTSPWTRNPILRTRADDHAQKYINEKKLPK